MAMQLMKSDIMQPIQRVLKSVGPEELISVLQVVVNLAFASDIVAQKMLTKDVLKSLKLLCAHKNPQATSLLLYFKLLNSLLPHLISWLYKIGGFLSSGTKISFVSSWKFSLLFGESSYPGYFRKLEGTTLALDGCA